MKSFLSLIFLMSALYLCACYKTDTSAENFFNLVGLSTAQAKSIIDTSGKTVATRINCPQGFARQAYTEKSFGFFLSNFPLKKHGSKVYYFNGEETQFGSI